MDLISKRLYYFLFSGILILAGLASQIISPDLRMGIEFSSGAIVRTAFEQPVTEAELRTTLSGAGYEDAVIQKTGAGEFFIRVRSTGDLDAQRGQIQKVLNDAHGTTMSYEFEAVSSEIARDAFTAAGVAVLFSVVGILLYITWAFRKVPSPFRYGVTAVAALLHDLLVTLAVSAIVAKFIPMEISTMFLLALLTVLGYSVSDTVVIFDRLRENIAKGVLRDFTSQVNFSLLETLTRSLNTGFTVIMVLLTLLFLGPDTTKSFVIALTAGMISGAYSSIFIAAQLLVSWETGSWTGNKVKAAKTAPPAATPAAPAARTS